VLLCFKFHQKLRSIALTNRFIALSVPGTVTVEMHLSEQPSSLPRPRVNNLLKTTVGNFLA
jgi:hypothetical protein